MGVDPGRFVARKIPGARTKRRLQPRNGENSIPHVSLDLGLKLAS
jgi:hypothetical protein